MNGLLCFALPVWVMTAYFGWRYLKERQSAQALDSSGESASATIVERGKRLVWQAGTVCFVTFQFETGSGEAIKQSRQVSSKAYEHLTEGERVPIRYLASDPNTAQLDGEYRNHSKETTALGIFAFCAVLSILFLVASLRP